MKRFLFVVSFFVLLALASGAKAQQLRWVFIDGTVTPPALQTDLPAAERPTVTRVGAGFYRLTFRRDVRFFNGDVQAGGPGRDATSMLFTSRYDTMNARVFDIVTYAVSPGPPVSLAPKDGRMSIVIVRP